MLGPEGFDVTFYKLPRARGSKGPAWSLNEKHLIRVLNEALKLKPSAVKELLQMIRANDLATYKDSRKVLTIYDDNAFGDDEEFDDPGNANRAMVILGIATIAWPWFDGAPPTFMIEPWAAEAGLKRRSRRHLHSADRRAIARHTRQEDADYALWTEWPLLPEPAPRKPERPKGPSFESMKFPPGVSGNPRGRPREPQYDVPYPYLQKRYVVQIEGVDVSMTRAQAFLYRMSIAEFPKDSSLPDLIAKTMVSIKKERWKRPPEELPVKPRQRTPGDLDFSQSLEFLFLARKLNRMRAGRRMVIEPWVVQQALDRLVSEREKPLSLIEQEIVVKVTRTPGKVNWPEWWQAEIPQRRRAGSDKNIVR